VCTATTTTIIIIVIITHIHQNQTNWVDEQNQQPPPNKYAGGNVAGSKADEVYTTANGVTMVGYTNLPARLPSTASTLFANNGIVCCVDFVAVTGMSTGGGALPFLLLGSRART
jgi:hypothetical protein